MNAFLFIESLQLYHTFAFPFSSFHNHDYIHTHIHNLNHTIISQSPRSRPPNDHSHANIIRTFIMTTPSYRLFVKFDTILSLFFNCAPSLTFLTLFSHQYNHCSSTSLFFRFRRHCNFHCHDRKGLRCVANTV
jgi:hypothetical protein